MTDPWGAPMVNGMGWKHQVRGVILVQCMSAVCFNVTGSFGTLYYKTIESDYLGFLLIPFFELN